MVNNDNFDYYKQANEVLGKARKISRSQLKAFTIKLLKEQGGVCAVCKQPISLRTAGAKSDYCVDHCHVTGLVRGVLHRSCNAALGKMENAAGRWGAKSMDYNAVLGFIRSAMVYYQEPFHPVIYPDHRTDEQKAEATRQKARVAAARRRAIAKMKEQQ
ncbi:endonuclease VII [Aeromonas phage PS]|uniref:Endonuclease VII n=1 Tax=Aeromonas phage PS TaxID=2723762 RepID=A0A6H0X6L0_9CAUD|nr:DNA endonuclease [Aeromonas phage PS]